MRYCMCPISFVRQTGEGLFLHINGYDIGYDELLYYKKGNLSDQHRFPIDSSDIHIPLSEFPLGRGYYQFVLIKGDTNSAPVSIYVSCETSTETLDKIVSYITKPEDANYIQDKVHTIKSVPRSYTEAFATIYHQIERKQPYELRSFYQMINVAERYENALILSMNRSSVGETSIQYETGFQLTPGALISEVEIYSWTDIGKTLQDRYVLPRDTFDPHFRPDQMYLIDLIIDGDLAAELVHYELDEAGQAYLWNQAASNANYIKSIGENNLELSIQGLELTDEDAARIIAERGRENSDQFMPRLSVTQSMYHDAVLTIKIDHYEALQAMEKIFYVSIREPDQFFDRSFDKRYRIDSPTLTISAQAELLAGEIILFIEDEDQVVVSPFTRFDLDDMVGYGEMNEYAAKQNAVEVNDYVTRYLKNITSIVGEGEFFAIMSNMMHSQAYDSDITASRLFYNTLVKSALSHELAAYSDNILYFTASEWMGQYTIDNSFFKRRPRFVNALDSFVFPTSTAHYIVVAEKIMVAEGLVADVSYQFLASSPNHSVSINVANGDMFLIYAIDAKTYKRSGFIFVNNIREREYYTNQIQLEARAND